MKEKTSNLKQPSDMLMELTNNQLLNLMQLTNANFPIGSFSHSFGLETYIRNNVIIDGETLKKVMKSFLFGQFLHVDLLSIRLIYKHLENNNLEEIFKIDQMVNSQGMSKETRKSTRHIGTQMLKIYLELFPEIELLQKYQQKISKKECLGHPAVVFALFCYAQKINLDVSLYVHLYSTSSALIQNCVRAIPLGQVEGQKIMSFVKQNMFDQIIERVISIDPLRNFCKNNPSFEIAQMNHEEILIRLFMS